MMGKTTLPNGRVIIYKDVIHHTAYVEIGLMDRIRVLFMGKLRVETEIYCAELPNVQGSVAKTYVNKIFNSYRRAFVSRSKQYPRFENATNATSNQ